MPNIKKHIPNLITLLNLFSGCIALTCAVKSDFEGAFFFVCLGIFFDFFDGFFARMLKVPSPLGLQLDSLADMVTSGLVPGYVIYKMLLNSQNEISSWPGFAFIGFLITLGSCYRLANFNIDTRQSDSFIGLPTPANALFILSLPLVLAHSNSLLVLEILTTQWVLLLIILASVFMLNAEIPLFSLKIKKMTYKDNVLQIFFLISSLLLLFFFNYLGISLLIIFYVFLSVVTNNRVKKHVV